MLTLFFLSPSLSLTQGASAGLAGMAGKTAQDLRKVAADAVDANADVEFNDATLRQWILWETEMTPDQSRSPLVEAFLCC